MIADQCRVTQSTSIARSLTEPYPQVEWIGIQKMLRALFEEATSVVVFVIGLGSVGFGAFLCRP